MLYRNTAGYLDASMVVIATGAALTAGTVHAFVQRTSDSKWLQADLSWNAVKPTTTAIPTMTHVSGGGWKLVHTPADLDDTYFVNCIDSGVTCYPDNYDVTVEKPHAKEDTLLALGQSITGIIDIGAGITSALKPIVMEKGEKLIVTVHILENGIAKDCTGYTAQLGVKEKLTDAAYKFTPLDGVFSNDATGVRALVTFTFLPATTKSMTPFGGLYSAAIFDAGGNKFPITDRGGLAFTLREDILDVI